ncbi:hypothetical protein Tco_1347294 [Tanacetum coccineum]
MITTTSRIEDKKLFKATGPSTAKTKDQPLKTTLEDIQVHQNLLQSENPDHQASILKSKLLRSLGWWAIPLDKGSFEEIPGIDSSWGEFVHPSLHGSGKNKGKNLEHDCVLRNSGNIEYAKDAEDPINVIVSILVLISEEGVFPQFAHELTLDLEIDNCSRFSGLTTPVPDFPRDNG